MTDFTPRCGGQQKNELILFNTFQLIQLLEHTSEMFTVQQ